MNITIFPNDALCGTLKAVPSKSFAHRALICAALADNPTKLNNLFYSEDILATIDCLTALGARFENGTVYPIERNNKASMPCELNCRESGSTLRFMLPLSLALGGNFQFKMAGRLPNRPLEPLYGELVKMGCTLGKQGENPFCASGKLKRGIYTLPGNVSSQFITGLLLSLPLLDGDSEIRIEGKLESAPYVAITRSVLQNFGIKIEFENNTFFVSGGQVFHSPEDYTIEGDWSNAAFWLCADKLSSGKITCAGLNKLSVQGDRQIIDILNRMPCEIDASDIPDLIPVISAVAAVTEGKTVIYNAKRLIIKESNRLKAIFELLSALGADITLTDDGLIICGKPYLNGGTVDSFNDHRMAMTAAIASLKCKNQVTVTRAEAVKKSYPDFWNDFKALGGNIKEEL